MTKTYVCKRLRLCRHLMNCGFTPYKIVPDRDNPRFNVWLFDQSPALTETIMQYFTRKEQRRLTEKETYHVEERFKNHG